MYNNMNVNVSGPIQPTSTYKTKILKGNHSFASQITEPNMKYVIKHDFDLGGETAVIPKSCLIEMDGGSISNGTMIGAHTILIYFQELSDCIKSVTMQGTWKYNNPIRSDDGTIYFNLGDGAKDVFGYPVTQHKGTSRPSGLSSDNVGFQFFDISLNKPIWWNGTGWVDATGATV